MAKRDKSRRLNLSGLAEGGFTLLEIMISLAIIGGLLVTVIYTLNYHLSLAERQEFQTIATMLSKTRLQRQRRILLPQKASFLNPIQGTIMRPS